MTNLRTQRVAALCLVLLALWLPGCEGDDDDNREEVDPLAGLSICGPMNQIIRVWGHTMQSAYMYGPLDEGSYIVEPNNDGSPRLRAQVPADWGECLNEMNGRVQSACAFCAASSVEGCLLELEAAINRPTANCVSCGDGLCTGDENREQCPEDCFCGDGFCDITVGEFANSCPEDCPASCGNGVCESLAGELCGTCPAADPTCTECAADCCRGVCGDATCDANIGETAENCEEDCGLTECGDGLCLGDESEGNCPEDCTGLIGNCSQNAIGGDGVCGDGICTGCEPLDCRVDCLDFDLPVCTVDESGQQTCPERYCGDGVCEGNERYIFCPTDCALDGDVRFDYCEWDTCSPNLDELIFALGACDAQHALCPDTCGDGYCSPHESRDWWRVGFCGADCGGPFCAGAGAVCLDAPADAGPRCAEPEGYGPMITDCSDGWCPIVEVCRFGCSDVDGTPTCDHCPGMPADAERCDGSLPPECVYDGNNWTVQRCEPLTAAQADNPACYRYTVEVCADQCFGNPSACQ